VLNASVYWDTNPIPVKYMMRKVGLLAHNEHRMPMVPATPELERRLDGVLERAGLIDDIYAVSAMPEASRSSSTSRPAKRRTRVSETISEKKL
jgi:hypothetical protein